MADKTVYEQLASMYETIGAPNTPALLKVLQLQFTPLEAKLAVQIGHTGGKLDELSERTGIEKSKLKNILYTMAEKGTMWIDPGVKDPTYRTIGLAAPGIIETGLWCGVKFPYTVELGKALHEFLYDWSKLSLCKMGFAFDPVWAAPTALPDDALPSENLAEALKGLGHWSTSPCPCRLAHRLTDPGNHCSHILDTCIHTGDLSRWAVEHGMARELTYEQVVDLLRKANEDGLVQTLNISDSVCNCCNDCCAVWVAPDELGMRLFQPSPFVSHVDVETCNACGTCEKRCPVKAIEVSEFAYVDQDVCFGCGVCVPTCKTESIKLVRRPKPEVVEEPVPAEVAAEE